MGVRDNAISLFEEQRELTDEEMQAYKDMLRRKENDIKYRMIHTYLGTKKIHFPIEMDLEEDDKTMEYIVHIPEQRLRVSIGFASDEPIWVGPTRWDFIKEEKEREKQEMKQEKQDNKELPMLGEAYW